MRLVPLRVICAASALMHVIVASIGSIEPLDRTLNIGQFLCALYMYMTMFSSSKDDVDTLRYGSRATLPAQMPA